MPSTAARFSLACSRPVKNSATCHFLDHLPSGGGPAVTSHSLLQLLKARKRHPAAVLQLRDHRTGRLVELLRSHAFRFRRGKYLPAAVSAQPL